MPGNDGQADPFLREKANTLGTTNQYLIGARPKTVVLGAQHTAAALDPAEPRGLPGPAKASVKRTHPP